MNFGTCILGDTKKAHCTMLALCNLILVCVSKAINRELHGDSQPFSAPEKLTCLSTNKGMHVRKVPWSGKRIILKN